ncbi:hypothetical protein P7C73_g1697, partial [Tremellales sp. Uapishka_1]
MKYLALPARKEIIGEYTCPTGFYDLVKSVPFLGSVSCNETDLIAGSWHDLHLVYTVGGSGLADGAWIKATFKDGKTDGRLVFQTSDPLAANYVSAEYEAADLHPGQLPSTVESLSVRFDQKGHERPFQKSIIVDVVDGFLNVGDKIHIRLGDRRAGGPGTRVQTFVEKDFRFRFYVDPVGTSRFAAVPTDIKLQILPGPAVKLVLIAPRLLRPSSNAVPVIVRAEDAWGNTITNKSLDVTIRVLTASTLVTADPSSPVERVLYADLHVHSDDTVGTNDSLYNFSYAKDCAGLDIVGYTANDFNITKKNWDATVALIDELNTDGDFTIYPGTEWCGNTAVGGDHNVVFLDENNREFPFDRHGNVARSFEWNEEMSTDTIEPGTWPIDDLYATYAHSPESHLLIPHIGGRRANLGWHHPRLERLIEVGSAWGQFEAVKWFLRDAISRGYKLGVSANSDEHRGRCGGGVPGTAVFGTRGGLTGVLSPCLDRGNVATALRARHTFATSGQHLVGLAWLLAEPSTQQGDEVDIQPGNQLTKIGYRFLGEEAGWENIQAHGWKGLLLDRNLHQETGLGGSRIRDRYREAIWNGSIKVAHGTVRNVQRMSEDDTHPEETHWITRKGEVCFKSSTSGDSDGLVLDVEWHGETLGGVSVAGTIDGYIKPQPYKHCPTFSLDCPRSDTGSSTRMNLGGADLFVAVEKVSRPGSLPSDVVGVVEVPRENGPHGSSPVWFSARQANGAKAWTSPIWLTHL